MAGVAATQQFANWLSTMLHFYKAGLRCCKAWHTVDSVDRTAERSQTPPNAAGERLAPCWTGAVAAGLDAR